ncbi:MAG: hypothetical protein HYZ91_01370 [Candidatus Omnitrophica bacterium]|nr:hypothetical protein [Candidatus Omnitrophota bacterium]
MAEPQQTDVASARSLWAVVIVLGLIGLGMVVFTAPLDKLLGPGNDAIRGAVHGMCAGLFMITATVGLFQGYRIFAGQAWNIAELQMGSVINAMMALMTIISGNWIYIPYRASTGPRSYFLQLAPALHQVFFEFKEFAALFTFPLAVVAAYLLVRYGAEVYRRRGLSTIVAVLLALVFFYFVVAFGLGAAITKMKSV